MRAWCSLRVVLDGEHRQLAMPKSFYTLIVEIHMRHTKGWGARNSGFRAPDGETVILRCDRHLAGVDLSDRLISAVVAERQLIRLGAVR